MKTLGLIALASVAALGTFDTPVVQVRDVASSPVVSIVAWDAADANVGIRTRLRRDGSILGQDRSGEDRLYISSSMVDARGGFALAVTQDGKLLRKAGKASDPDACRFDNVCTPRSTVDLGVPDEWLRQHKDGIEVTMRPHDGQNWTVRLDGAVIAAYLAAVDSASAALKAKQ